MKAPAKGPKILVLDIETRPILGYVWGLWENNVAINQIHTDWCILAFSAKWYNQEEIVYYDQRKAKNIENDKPLLRRLWKLLDQADIIVTQNGKRFDEKKINARFILNGMPPPSSFRHIDTKELAKRRFGFTSNRLEYLTDKLCTQYKKKTKRKYAGFDLWKECLAGNQEAWEEMEDYNRYDVLSLEELYTKLAPWDSRTNFDVYHNSLEHVCSCGSTSHKKQGFKYTNTGKYQR